MIELDHFVVFMQLHEPNLSSIKSISIKYFDLLFGGGLEIITSDYMKLNFLMAVTDLNNPGKDQDY